ncbi:MAG: hypothetical protein HY547_05640 [Elusimicrobia bacterium]|nr:hypothetical protein [Elusimicrobiota bacterium]
MVTQESPYCRTTVLVHNYWQYVRLKLHRRGFGKSLAGALAMACFAFLSMSHWWKNGSIFFLLLFFKNFLFAIFLISRKAAIERHGLGVELLAYISAGLPLFYMAAPNSQPSNAVIFAINSMSLTGFLVATLAVIELGTLLGVAPAVRGARIRSGVYAYFRHPMYSGYVLAELGWVLLDLANLPIFVLSLSLYCLRAHYEERLFRQYQPTLSI